MSDSKKPKPHIIEEWSAVPLLPVKDAGERYHGPHGRPTRMKKLTVSEIVAREQRVPWTVEAIADFIDHAKTDIPYLLDLVERMGEALERKLYCCNHPCNNDINCRFCKEARALLEEVKK